MMSDTQTPDESEPSDNPQEESSESATLPISVLGGKDVQPGDEVSVKVVSVDSENGTVTVECCTDSGEMKKPGGVDAMASEFGQSGGE
jgi:hypothetical protein